MTPLYGFLEGDTIGVLVLADEQDTMAVLAEKLQSAALTRVPPRPHMRVLARGTLLPPELTVVTAGLSALDRFDVVTDRGTP